LIGGFKGTEKDPAMRDSLNLKTILDGAINESDTAIAIVEIPAVSDNVTLSTLTIVNSHGSPSLGTAHGGVYALNSNNLTLFRCILSNNYPCGIEAGKKTIVKQCIIEGNNGVNGAGISIRKDSVMIMHSVITNNTVSNNGGGIYVYVTGSAIIINSNIVNNLSTTANRTAGIYKVEEAPLYLANSIIWGNTVNGGTTEGSQINSTDTVIRCNIQDTVIGIGIGYRAITNSSGWLGVFSENPDFVSVDNPIGNDVAWFTNDDGLMLNSESKLIDKGSGIPNHSEWNSKVDIRGKEIERALGVKNYDIGAYDQ